MITPATLTFRDGVPYSERYGDVYHTRSGGLEQARQVFLAGNDLPGRWQSQESFAILETGFGLGLNFLTTWAAWRNDPKASARLHFVSVEKHPFTAADLAIAHQYLFAETEEAAEFALLAAELRQHWPTLVPGYHRLHLNHGRVILTLILGDATEELRRVEGSFNAFYLDGFSPATNPELWSHSIAWALKRCAAPGATLATWSVAGSLREALHEAGFDLRKIPGFGTKRHQLAGVFRHQRPVRYHPPRERTALVIGAGIAGSSIAERLASRGWQVTVLESEDAPGQCASGNVAGVMRPLPSADDNPLARLTRAGFSAVRQHAAQLITENLPARVGLCGVLHLAQSAEQASHQRKALQRLQLPPEYLQFLETRQASELLGYPVTHGGWFFPQGGWVQPPSVCAANLLRFPEQVTTRYQCTVADLRPASPGGWEALAADGSVLARAAIAVIASGAQAPRLSPLQWLPQKAIRGQVTHLPEGTLQHPVNTVVCGHGYITPVVDGLHVVGASTLEHDTCPDLRIREHEENLTRLQTLLPGCLPTLPDNAALAGRVGLRPASPDRLPIVGPVPVTPLSDRGGKRPPLQPGLWCILGFGARGIVWSALMAELLVSQIQAEPLPLPADLVRALSPSRAFPKQPADSECDNMSQV